jgi:hypothetical protein
MKRFAALLVLIAVLSLNVLFVSGEGISVSSENGDKINIFNDIGITVPIKGNVVSVLGNVTVDSNVNGQVVAVFGDITVNAEVSGQVVTVFGNTVLKKDAVVKGDVITIGSLSKDADARILGQEVRILGKSMNLDINAIIYLRLAVMILFSLAVLIVGLLILVISREHYKNIADTIENNVGKKLLLGILSFLAASILLLLLVVTLVAPILYIVVLVLATITASMFLGRMILKTFSPKNSIYMEFITGLISITLFKLLLLFLVPQEDLLLGFGLVGVFDLLIYSMGLGIHMEKRYIKNN